MDVASKKETLGGYLTSSRAVQRTMSWIGAIGIGLGLCFWVGGAGWFGLAVAALAAIVGGAGVWITQGHIADFEQQLRDLDRPSRTTGATQVS
jgi:hypothetical protein